MQAMREQKNGAKASVYSEIKDKKEDIKTEMNETLKGSNGKTVIGVASADANCHS
jgi:hypothetical protein